MILYSHLIYEKLSPWLSIFERKVPHRELDSSLDVSDNVDVLLVGLGRYGTALADNLRNINCRVLAVDFDPAVVERHTREGYPVHYGDAEDPEFVATLPLAHARWVVSTVRDRTINRMLLHGLRQQAYRGKVAIAASNQHDKNLFEQDGVDLVLIPYSDAAKEAAIRLMPSARPMRDEGEVT
jgi:Trk K+ transport system NAD-binding subunit